LNYLCTPFREFLNGNGSVVLPIAIGMVRIHVRLLLYSFKTGLSR
jgi:hypothetical protein